MKPINQESIKSNANQFLTKVFKKLNSDGLLLEHNWHIDHLCFRTSTIDNYLSAKAQFESFSKLLIESEVNGRLISTFKLDSPIIFDDWEIDLIEVPAPKIGKLAVDGFEHFEIVCDLTFDEIRNRFCKYRFDDSGLAKDFNQELELLFDGFALKFHHVSLESVINIEANESVFNALKSSNILKYLKPFSPLVAGTFPLNVNVAGSDIDILISGADFEPMKSILIDNFKEFSSFKCSEILVQGERALFASFSYQGIDFEIIGQQTPAIKQKAYLHFLIEERLLKLGGINFTKEVKEARKQGLKTEPAFAKVLGLKGDPYKELLVLQKKSNQDLKALVSIFKN